MTKWNSIYQQEMKDAFDVVIKQVDTNTAEKLLSSGYEYDIHGLLEMLRTMYAEPANGRQECYFVASSDDPHIFLIRIQYIVGACPLNYPELNIPAFNSPKKLQRQERNIIPLPPLLTICTQSIAYKCSMVKTNGTNG